MSQKRDRRRLYREQGGICHWCHKTCLDLHLGKYFSDTFTVDHIIPRSRGGLDNRNNKVGACHECNKRRNEIEVKLVAVQRFFEYFKQQPLNLFPVDGLRHEIWLSANQDF